MKKNNQKRFNFLNYFLIVSEKNYEIIDSLINLGVDPKDLFNSTDGARDEEVQQYLILKCGTNLVDEHSFALKNWEIRNIVKEICSKTQKEDLIEYLLNDEKIVRVIAQRKIIELETN